MKLTYSIQVFHKQFKMSCCELLLTENQCILQSREFVIGIGIDSVSLDDNGLVLNFSFIKCEMKKLISEFNKKILIATKKPDQILDEKLYIIKMQLSNYKISFKNFCFNNKKHASRQRRKKYIICKYHD